MGVKKCAFIGCDEELTGKQRKFCSDRHRKLHERIVNKPYYVQYQRVYMRKYRENNRKERFCIKCGKELPKYKKKFCSLGCYIKWYVKAKEYDDGNRYAEMPMYMPDECGECGGDIKRDGHDAVCVKCGLVQE